MARRIRRAYCCNVYAINSDAAIPIAAAIAAAIADALVSAVTTTEGEKLRAPPRYSSKCYAPTRETSLSTSLTSLCTCPSGRIDSRDGLGGGRQIWLRCLVIGLAAKARATVARHNAFVFPLFWGQRYRR